MDKVANFKKFITPFLIRFKGIQKFRSFEIRMQDGEPQIFPKVDTLVETQAVPSNRLGSISLLYNTFSVAKCSQEQRR
jgi:hypothetical protein